MSSVPKGTIIAGKYRIVDKIGSGGMGTVYRARHLTLDRDVAVKILHGEYTRNADHRARFEREAKVAAQLDHENAISIFDFGYEDDLLYLVMEILQGSPLLRLYGKGKPFKPQKTALKLAWQVADVLVEAHHIGLVHRDLKPENIMVESRSDGSQRAIVVDFGLAFLQQDENLSRMTREGVVSGTPAFISPEQARGLLDISPAADVYSFGCVLHEVFTGYPVFRGTEVIDLLNKHLFVPPESPMQQYPNAHVPAALDDLILAMLEKDPADRPSILKVRDWLGQLAELKSPRDRGRPERFLHDRTERAVTESGVPQRKRKTKQYNASTESGRLPTSNSIVVGVVGDIEHPWRISLSAAGFQPVQIEEAEASTYPIVFYPTDDSETIKTIAGETTLIIASEISDVGQVTELLKAGAYDVVKRPIDPADLVKKIERAWRKRSRTKGKS